MERFRGNVVDRVELWIALRGAPSQPGGSCDLRQKSARAEGAQGETLDWMDDEGHAPEYACAFCSEGTADDPRWIRIDLRWDHSEASQQLGAHFACLQAALRPGFPLYDGLE